MDREPNVRVRKLRPGDLQPVIHLDAKITGRRREQYFEHKLKMALADTGVQLSLAAEVDGCFCGFLLCHVYYGEFGTAEQVAVLDTLGVNPDFGGKGVGAAMFDQLVTNLDALGIRALETEVGWNDQRLLSFFQHAGFQPAPRFCLDLDVRAARAQKDRRLAEQAARQP